MYSERPSGVPGAVLWTSSRPGPQRVLPDGSMDLLWFGDRLLVAGPDTSAYLAVVSSGTIVTGLRFAPGTAPLVLGAPAHELRDRRVPLDDVWSGAEARCLTTQIQSGRSPGSVLEAAAIQRLGVADPDLSVSAQLAGIVQMVRAGAAINAVADQIGLSERQLHRRSLAAFGYGAKTLGRVLRLQRALAFVYARTPLAEVAARAGYADQAHLARDVRSLTGVTLAALRQ